MWASTGRTSKGFSTSWTRRRRSCARIWKNIPRRAATGVGAGVAGARGAKVSPELRARLEDEVGDLFFVLVNIARYLSLDPESALRKTNRKFRRRFQYLEERLREQGSKPADASLDELESLWQESKQQEKAVSDGTFELRNCTEVEEFRACVALQKEVWGFADNELVPLRIFSLAPKIGGQVIGAWDGDDAGRLCVFDSRHAQRTFVPAFAHAGGEGRISQQRRWAAG